MKRESKPETPRTSHASGAKASSAKHVESEIRALVAAAGRGDASRLERDDDFCRRLGLDSLDRLTVLASVEKRFDVSFSDEQIAELRSLADVVGAVEALRSEHAR